MGQLVDGKWQDQPVPNTSGGGAFRRAASQFRNWITADGTAGPSGDAGFKAESGRYHLYVSHACPWAHRTLIFRHLKGLRDHISVSVVHPDMLENGWTFATDDRGATGDDLFGFEFAHQIYTRADPHYYGRVTVPILWDKVQGTIVSNESAEIIRMFNQAFDEITGNSDDFWPAPLREQIEEVNDRIYDTLNNGVYKCGFARSQSAYDASVQPLFETLDWLEDRLATRRYLMGDVQTEADWRLFTTLVRFDPVYHVHFKCSRNRIVDFPNLWAYARELFQMPGIAGTVNFDHIIRHYFFSHESINPYRTVPLIKLPEYAEPHRRDGVGKR